MKTKKLRKNVRNSLIVILFCAISFIAGFYIQRKKNFVNEYVTVDYDIVDTKKEYKEGTIDRDQVVSRIILLREKSIAPDEVTADNIDDLLDFSPEYIKPPYIHQNLWQNSLLVYPICF